MMPISDEIISIIANLLSIGVSFPFCDTVLSSDVFAFRDHLLMIDGLRGCGTINNRVFPGEFSERSVGCCLHLHLAFSVGHNFTLKIDHFTTDLLIN